ncbi:DNA-processing protein DprA [Rufibacter latericius]|uniref:DNA-protecting protein DprA n=1 Tax=Rufibacter latericius TaxID=2487040 RepID=A0A3M9MYL5_9BACT|nr:DNA-processing protein DprA [Rufibacter latericius]RNI30624.1 DNA-protecting protein DprA [Rufibacter latericius]
MLHEVALPLIPGIGGGNARLLVSYCGSAQEVFLVSKDRLKKIPGVGEILASRIASHQSAVLRQAELILKRATQEAVKILFYTSPEFPTRLRNLPDAPLLLYYKGTADLNASKIISIVGTRKSTEYGRVVTEQLVQGLVKHQALVVSGLAYGIDVAAHRAALKAGLPTVGVMATGIESVYPAVHKSIADKMLHQGGLLTEFPYETKPDAPRFPARNRIIAGLADCTIVVESTQKGGSLISADIAHGYDREVMAVPGPITSETSQGCNQLIKTLKAVPFTQIKDLEELLNWDKALASPAVDLQEEFNSFQFTEEERRVLRALKEAGPTHIDVLSRHIQLSMNQLSTILLTLEFSGKVKSLPGKQFALV